MRIELESTEVRPGDALDGTVVDDDGGAAEASVWLERQEGDRHKLLPHTAARCGETATVLGTGQFRIIVPEDAHPSWRSRHARLEWSVVAKASAGAWTEDSDDPDGPSFVSTLVGVGRSTVRSSVTIDSPPARRLDPDLLATAGDDPPRLRRLVGEHFLSIAMGLIFFAMFVGLGIAVLMSEPPDETSGQLVFAIACFAVAAVPLGVTYAAARTVWPKRPRGIELEIEPAVVAAGERFRVVRKSRRPERLQFMSVESYWTSFGIDTILSSHDHRRSRRGAPGQFATSQRFAATVDFDEHGSATVRVPDDAVPTYLGEVVQVRWVLRTGGGKIGRWGPIKLREWHIIVTPGGGPGSRQRGSLTAEGSDLENREPC